MTSPIRTKRTYTDEEKARAYTILQINDGNVYRTARDAGIPRSTITVWTKEWEADGVPDELVLQAIEESKEFVEEAEEVRFIALQKIRTLIPLCTEKQLQALGNITGILDDKIRLAKGLATSRSEKVVALPSPEELQEKLGSFLRSALSASKEREYDIDLEVEEQPLGLLPSAEDNNE